MDAILEQRIVELYLTGLNQYDVGDVVGKGHSTVSLVLRKYGVSRPNGVKIRKCKPFTKEFIDYLDGLLLSDGNYQKPAKQSYNSRYCHSSVTPDWLETIVVDFEKFGVLGKVRKENRLPSGCCAGYTCKQVYYLTTLRYDKLYEQYLRWYPNGVKRVPRDIDLTSPVLWKNWIYGDGSNNVGSRLRLATHSFVDEDLDFLVVEAQRRMGVFFQKYFARVDKEGRNNYELHLTQHDGLKLLFQAIGKPDQACFGYKWPGEFR